MSAEFHTFDIWNGTQYTVSTGWMEGMKVHWYYLTTSLDRRVEITVSYAHVTSALSGQASYMKVVVRFE